MPAIVDRPQDRSKGELSTGNRKQTFRMIDPRRLRVLQAVATGGSVAAAAQALHLTPPAVSQQLRALEGRLAPASSTVPAGRRR